MDKKQLKTISKKSSLILKKLILRMADKGKYEIKKDGDTITIEECPQLPVEGKVIKVTWTFQLDDNPYVTTVKFFERPYGIAPISYENNKGELDMMVIFKEASQNFSIRSKTQADFTKFVNGWLEEMKELL